ncbi:kinase-like protein [Calocera viscosa TUFC12733]|uniref:Kinase-like protein n=1 Tax=Calocera viscosa (strain TUFC12733) TaxID=1330018 RepID=A0A167IB56_CALVF|nr:kinase-like protein [Calocera viscosa TUFC12733]
MFRDLSADDQSVSLSLTAAWTWSKLHHPNIVPFLGVADYAKISLGCGHQLCLVSPWMSDGDIMSYISNHASTNKMSLLSDVLEGLKYLHKQDPPVIHGGLKGSNVLVDASSGQPRALITDFGQKRLVQRFTEEYDSRASYHPALGNPRWLAYERLFPWKYGLEEDRDIDTFSSDVFELMRTFLEVLTGKAPYCNISSDRSVLRLAMQEQPPERPREGTMELDDQLWELMLRAWSTNRAQRPGLGEIGHVMTSLRDEGS